MSAIRIVAALCAVAAATTAWDVPAIPAGRRAQYYLLKDDGAYQFGYDTGAGHSASAAADAANEVLGAYQYTAADGRDVAVRYSAGQGGYVPQVSGVEVPANAGAGVSRISPIGAAAGGGSSAADQDPDYDANADASYSFSIDTDSYKRHEQADSRGNVRGQYSYSSPDGGSQSLTYEAGEGTGFVVTGGPSAPAATTRLGSAATRVGAGGVNSDGSYSFSYNAADQSRQESADAQNNVRGSYSFRAKDDGKTRRIDYEAGAATGFVARGDHLPVGPSAPSVQSYASGASRIPAATSYSGPLANIQNEQNADGSYSFAFGTDFQSRQESADALNNVKGSYSYTSADDGKTRRVDYQAGAATGFLARGNHLPVPPDPGSHSTHFSAPAPLPATPALPYAASSASAQGSNGADGSYSFAFNTDEQSRQESADAQNNVRGSYSFKAKDDGKVRRVDYEAGAATGFIARGDHLPVAPTVPNTAPAVTAYSSPVAPVSSYLPPSASSYSSSPSDAQSDSNVDGSYSFSYSTQDQSRQESADAHNNVRGSYSFRAADDGQTRRVDYEAGAATGFVATGAHLPVAPAVPAPPVASSYAAPAPPSVRPYSAPSTPSSYAGSSSNAQGALNPDGSYSFSYSAPDHSRQESADAQNNVRGSYSFRAKDDGKTRRVDYEAGAATGFVARGDHLPKAPAAGVPAAPAASYPAPIARAGTTPVAAATAAAANTDGSYSFSYDAGDHSRQEASDASGNVRGSFSFVAKDDGRSRRVDYSAGAATGFVATGAHLPASADHAAASAAAAAARSGAAYSDADSSSGDAAYSYNYQTDSSSKTESADAQGNVQGEYSYIGGDGARRRVSYTARNNEGFVATGDLGPAAVAAGAGVGAQAGVGASSRVGSASHSHSSHSHDHSHGALTVRTGGLTVNQYLPPQSAQKFGYVFDTKA